MNLALTSTPIRRLMRDLGSVAGQIMAKPPRAPAQTIPAAQHVAQERRGAPRFALQWKLLIRRRGAVPAAATLINISASGAAIRIEPILDVDAEQWPYLLANGDEIWLSGLLNDPVDCWVIGVERDVLRVRFVQDDLVYRQISAFIKQWGGKA